MSVVTSRNDNLTAEERQEEQIIQSTERVEDDNYDGPPDDPDAWSGGFARNH